MQYLNRLPAKIVCWPSLAVVLGGLMVNAACGEDTRSAEEIQKAHQQQTAKLLKIIESEELTAEKAAAFEELAAFGSKEAIHVLAKLLSDDKLSHYARFSLEANPDPAVDEAFRAALGTLKGKLLVGVINSIGVRKDAQAVDLLAGLLDNEDADAASAAANSLGCIANQAAADALTKAFDRGPEGIPAGIGIGAVVCAENMAEKEMTDSAIALFDVVRKSSMPTNIKMAGLRGAILARGDDGLELMTEQLGSNRTESVDIALRTARELGCAGTTKALLAKLESLKPATKARVILALGDLEDSAALSAVVDAAQSDADNVKLAAIVSLKKLGDVTVVPVLWKSAMHSDTALKEAAVATLAKLPGQKVDAAIAKKLDSDDASGRAIAVLLVGKRRISSATPQLLKIAGSSDKSLKLAAITALGETVTLQGLDGMIDRVVKADDNEMKAVTSAALKAACVRMPDREATAKLVAGRVASSPDEVKTALLTLLTSIGGDAALDCLVQGAKGKDPVVQEKATELLGKWVGSDIGPVLFELVKTIDSQKYRIRLLRGYIRLARQFGLPPEETITICTNALQVAERVDEKKIVLDVLARNPSPAALALVVTQLGDPALGGQAAGLSVRIAESVARTEPEAVVAPLKKLLAADVKADAKAKAKAILAKATK